MVLLLGFLWLPGVSLGGAIKGKVIFAGNAPAPKKIDVVIDQFLCGTQQEVGDLLLSPQKEIRNTVVWIENPPAGAAWPAKPAKVEMDQKGCIYIPRMVVVPVGGTVDFLNSDRLLHNIHATPKLNVPFNLTQPKNRTIPITFTKPEIVRIVCDLHPWMVSWVVVAAHPLYAVTGLDGQFAFDNLPPGQYKLQAWHERLGTVSASVTVGDKQPAQVTVEMKAP
jgi:plastocyanin